MMSTRPLEEHNDSSFLSLCSGAEEPVSEARITCRRKKPSIYEEFRIDLKYVVSIVNHKSSSSRYKPGGTLVTAIGNLVGRVTEKVGNEMGRWSNITMTGTNGRHHYYHLRIPSPQKPRQAKTH